MNIRSTNFFIYIRHNIPDTLLSYNVLKKKSGNIFKFRNFYNYSMYYKDELENMFLFLLET